MHSAVSGEHVSSWCFVRPENGVGWNMLKPQGRKHLELTF